MKIVVKSEYKCYLTIDLMDFFSIIIHHISQKMSWNGQCQITVTVFNRRSTDF